MKPSKTELVNEEVTEQGSYVLAPPSSRTWQLQLHGSGVRAKKRLRKGAEVRHVSGVSLNGDLRSQYLKL